MTEPWLGLALVLATARMPAKTTVHVTAEARTYARIHPAPIKPATNNATPKLRSSTRARFLRYARAELYVHQDFTA